MEVKLHHIFIRDLFKGYVNSDEDGVIGYSGKLDIRPNIRTFSENMKREAYERQQGLCKNCGKHFEYAAMEGDHIDPWHSGGKTNATNCQMLCKQCNRR
jgi:hypothetical protein